MVGRVAIRHIPRGGLRRRRIFAERMLEEAGEEFDEEGRGDACDAWAGDCALLIECLIFHGLLKGV